MNKKARIVQILREMKLDGITLKDLSREMTENPDFLAQKFDLLCLVNGVPHRLPFDQGRHKEPIGIFPFAGNWYLELTQDESQPRSSANEQRLPDRDIWLELYKLQDALNAQLRAMGKPLLSGSYFARGGNLNWIIRINGSKEPMPENYYPTDTLANIRYGASLEP
ncbi:MAG: hypothetical protein IJ218_03705 [Alphaproteobacteria bacterium]|nr:hypothetical protein [Alphaproteobacteria bacterium]